jgi:hypothetical protein
MIIVKLFIAVRFNNIGASSLMMAIAPKHVGEH